MVTQNNASQLKIPVGLGQGLKLKIPVTLGDATYPREVKMIKSLYMLRITTNWIAKGIIQRK